MQLYFYNKVKAASCIEQIRRHLSTKQQLYGHQPPTMKTIQVRRDKHGGYSWLSKDELSSTPVDRWMRKGLTTS